MLAVLFNWDKPSRCRAGNSFFTAFNSTSLCCLSLRGFHAAITKEHLRHS
jgi:hypothetical protein